MTTTERPPPRFLHEFAQPLRNARIKTNRLGELVEIHWKKEEAALPRAKPRDIHKAIEDVTDKALSAGEKPPNINEIPRLVRDALQAQGYRASVRKIKALAADPRHAARRLRRGQKFSREKLSVS